MPRPSGPGATRSVPSSASTRWRRPVSPEPAGSAPPGPSSAISTRSCGRRRDAEMRGGRARSRTWRRWSAPRRRRSTPRSRPTGGRPRARAAPSTSTGIGRARGRAPRPPPAGRGRRGPAGRCRARGRAARRSPRSASARARRTSSAASGGRRAAPRRGQLHRQRDEPGLRAVVQVALDPPQLGGLDVERAAAGAGQLVDALDQPALAGPGQPVAVEDERLHGQHDVDPSTSHSGHG